MATSFKDIYCLADVIRNDSWLVGKPQNLVYVLFYLYLEHSISYFVYDCNVDLNDNIPFSQQEYGFMSDGLDNQYLLSPAPPTDCEFYVGYRENDESQYIQTYDFSYDLMTNILTINDNPPINWEVYVSGYIVGQFNNSLNVKEKAILAQGMNVPWSQGQVFKNSLLNQMVYGGTTKIYSQANHINSTMNVVNNQYYKYVMGMINEYSYKASPNNLKGLGGGLV